LLAYSVALSAFLAFSDRVVYSSHGAAHPAANALALQDQELAGALMWCWVTFAYLIPAIGITVQILAPAHSREAVP
jgi:putative membrane protein